MGLEKKIISILQVEGISFRHNIWWFAIVRVARYCISRLGKFKEWEHANWHTGRC